MSDKNNKPMFDVKGLHERLNNIKGRYQEGGSFANFDRFKPEPGVNKIRLIPILGEPFPFVPMGWHREIMGKSVLCLKYTSHDKDVYCPLCTLVNDLKRTGEEKNVNLAQKIKSNPMSAWVVVNRLDKERDEEGLPKLKVWYASKRVSQQLVDYLDEPETWGNFLDFDEGHDIQLNKTEVRTTGKGGYTSYTLGIIPQTSPVVSGVKKLEKLLEKMPEIAFNPRSVEDLEKLVSEYYTAGGLKKTKEFESPDEMDATKTPFEHEEEPEVEPEDDEKELTDGFGVPPSEKEEEEETSGDSVDDKISKILGD